MVDLSHRFFVALYQAGSVDHPPVESGWFVLFLRRDREARLKTPENHEDMNHAEINAETGCP